MEHQKVTNLLDNTPNQIYKFRIKNLIEINDDSHRKNDIKRQIKFKSLMLMSSLCDYSPTWHATS